MITRHSSVVLLGGPLVAALGLVASPALAQNPPANPPAPASSAPAAAPAPAPTPDTTTPAPSATPPTTEATPPAGESTEAKDEEEEGDASTKDSDAEPAAPSNKPSPSLIFLQSRRKAAQPAQPVDQPLPDDGLLGTAQRHVFANAGFRFAFVPTSGYDAFSKDNSFIQFSGALGATVTTSGNFSGVVSVIWDWGRAEGTARVAKTTLEAHRLTLGLEGRYHLFRPLYFFARVAPGALRWDATLEDGGAGVEREAGAWTMAADFSGGAAFQFAGQARGASKQARGWVLLDGGYGWAAASDMEFVAGEGTSPPARLAPLELGEMAMRGAFFRVAAAVTY
jgi:hypothetical protein